MQVSYSCRSSVGSKHSLWRLEEPWNARPGRDAGIGYEAVPASGDHAVQWDIGPFGPEIGFRGSLKEFKKSSHKEDRPLEKAGTQVDFGG